MLLAGDVGGTKTKLAVYDPQDGLQALVKETLPSGRYSSLTTLVQDFLHRARLPVKRARFGVAGPVVEGKAAITNLPWRLDEEELARALGLGSVRLLNDLEAIASAIPHLQAADLATLNEGTVVRDGAIGVVAPGTGLGEAYLTWDGRRYQAHASEGGHTDFAPVNGEELDLLRYLLDRYPHISYERVISGRGLPNIYRFLRDSGRAEEPPWLAQRLAASADPTPIIVDAALDPSLRCRLCRATLEMFVSILGAEAGNLALKILATGGIYLGGGIPPRLLPFLQQRSFMEGFTHKGRFDKLLREIPVHVITNPDVALIGAAFHDLMPVVP